MLEFLRREVTDLEICIVGFKDSLAGDLKDQATRGKVFYFDNDVELFAQKKGMKFKEQYEQIEDKTFVNDMKNKY